MNQQQLFLNKTVYKQDSTLNSTGIIYGIGVYTIYYSTMYSQGTFPKNLLFDFNVDVNGSCVHFDVNQYNSIDGVYNKLNFIVADYTGDWVILMLPNPIILTKYSFIARSGMEHRAPGEWKCYGSNDGSTLLKSLKLQI